MRNSGLACALVCVPEALADPEKNFLIIMKDGRIDKNTLPR